MCLLYIFHSSRRRRRRRRKKCGKKARYSFVQAGLLCSNFRFGSPPKFPMLGIRRRFKIMVKDKGIRSAGATAKLIFSILWTFSSRHSGSLFGLFASQRPSHALGRFEIAVYATIDSERSSVNPPLRSRKDDNCLQGTATRICSFPSVRDYWNA
jgi:hypothetical protein